MQNFVSLLRCLMLACLFGVVPVGSVIAVDEAASSFGEVVIPSPTKPADASDCVEPVDVMRRDHMKFLMHQRDATVLEGERDSKYSLVGCMDCHNPAGVSEEIIRYENPKHFCAECHAYTSVKIDCFECHADRGLARSEQSSLTPNARSRVLSAHTFSQKLEQARGD
ncbi:MAG: sulfur reduction protein DsrJ [Gammaproteobacteria bacterium]|nr:sulfur reduction protein DsrJ [Gammaproteobacteria bacterium]